MRKLKFSELSPTQKRLVFWLADKAETLTPTILDAAEHIGELWEAMAFLRHFPQGDERHTQLVKRLQNVSAATGSILDCIRRVSPAYVTLGQRCELELTDMILEPDNASAGL